MSSEQDFKKLSTSSGGGYKPIQELEDKISEVNAETSKERALRQKLERQAELEYNEEDNARWSANRNRAIEENGTSDIYEGISKAKEAIINFFNPKIGGEVPPFNLEEVLANPELEAITPVYLTPQSIAINDAASLTVEGEEFINNPTLVGAARLISIAAPGKVLDDVVEDLPLKKITKSLRTMKRFKVPCFKPGKGLKDTFKGKERELEHHFARQLKYQEQGLNDLTVGEYLGNRKRYKEMKRDGTGAAQKDFRERFSRDLNDSLEQDYQKSMSPRVAREKAAERTNEIMDNLAALHDPDMIAGGNDKVIRMGDAKVNSSIGPQWRYKQRLKGMDEAAEKALADFGPDTKMNVSLSRCPLNGTQ
ncbi:polymorphic toxin type 15 domain-containing protein [Vibrio campbellii]|uniref:polymorphic toxin type 15 domain-containing protein n=1 Tax=Vibrio campbellii TaxID=680 RepID=UPI00210E30DA|nr:polymorphic toxin type 15 domain-containing protein [Vibrio campbellii]UTZ44660.1 hypothetical protein HB764_25705 [Vibrio campbellii]